MSGQPLDDALVDLLVSRAVGDLDAREEERLRGRLNGLPAHVAEGYDHAAAAIHLAFVGADLQPLPSAMRSRLEQRAGTWNGGDPSAVPSELRALPPAVEAPAPSSPAASPWLGWLVAAACLLLAFGAWRQRAPSPGVTTWKWETLAAQEGTVELPWTPTEDALAEGASGAVLWNPSLQCGFMRIEHLATNDPSEHQYQLWIFDAQRDARYPVDGGVFDVPGEGPIIVPIDARLKVAEATLFAVTYERAGGVVVSARDPIVLTAQPL